MKLEASIIRKGPLFVSSRLMIEFRRTTTAASADPMPRPQEIANGEKEANKHHERD
jgi:hypothetical protein